MADTGFGGELAGIRRVITGREAGNFGLAAGPAEAGGAHALAFGKTPEGRAGVPGGVGDGVGVGGGEAGLANGIEKAVGEEAVVTGIEAGDEGEVVGKSERRIGGQHAFRRRGALPGEGEKVAGVVALGVVPAEAVEGDENDIVLGLGARGVGRGGVLSQRARGSQGKGQGGGHQNGRKGDAAPDLP